VRQDTPVPVRAKEFDYAVAVERCGRLTIAGEAALELGAAWTPEHLVLAGLARCTLTSLRYHAGRAGVDVAASASACGRVTKRESDGRYAFVEIGCELDVELEPAPPDDELRALLAKAERDCFVGASLTVPTRYAWRVNGADAAPG
jgi:organic hydroperoxide reductase OsmC/OhrA